MRDVLGAWTACASQSFSREDASQKRSVLRMKQRLSKRAKAGTKVVRTMFQEPRTIQARGLTSGRTKERSSAVGPMVCGAGRQVRNEKLINEEVCIHRMDIASDAGTRLCEIRDEGTSDSHAQSSG